MILAVNIGNSNINCAVGTKDNNQQAIVPTSSIRHADDFIRSLETQFQTHVWSSIQGSIISSVVPNKTPIVADDIHKRTNVPSQRIDISKCKIDISGYKSSLGEDRAVCCSAALAKYKPPFIVVDLGTATTINYINSESIFQGGAILTGVQIGLDALSNHTALLPQVKDLSSVPIIGADTRENLLSGAIIGTACAVEGYIRRIKAQLQVTPTVIITGGNAPVITPFCEFDFVFEPTLLLDGLFSLYNYKECVR